MQARADYFVYVDEAGDRGWGGASSPYFVLTAVIVRAADDHLIRSRLDQLVDDFKRPQPHVLHWAENIRDHTDRKHVARTLATLPIRCISVVVDKDALIGSGTGLNNSMRQYNYPMRRLLERVSWYINNQWGVGKIYLAHVRRFKYEELYSYLDYLRRDPDCSIRWKAFAGPRPTIEQPNKIRGLQVADMVAGSVFAALRPDRHGDQEPAYLYELAHRFWVGGTRKLGTYGLHFIGGSRPRNEQFAWWDEVARRAGC
ncbi:DUF3800 domain-containing protein [Micromonospora maritima]|uniref:DUF3800 domain-containing protein n=1 Tax=Micromonospora maritima TaxID=986711 RepID=A0ABW7ZED9_9ACTN